jgi:hypothetical protein
MVGTVNVGAAPTPTPTPAPPPTGTGTVPDRSTSPAWFLALAALMTALAGAGVILTTRR